MVHNIHILFFLYRSKTNEKGTMPIFCRLTLDGKRKQFSTSFYLKEDSWNVQTQRYRGVSIDAQHINSGLESIRINLLRAYDAIAKESQIYTVEHIYNRYAGKDKDYKSLLQAFEYHNNKMKQLIGKDYVQATYDKFVVIQNHIEDFIKLEYNLTDYPLVEIKLKFLHDLDHYLKVTKGHNQNTINKVIERVKKVIKIALGNGWIVTDPFILYQKKKHIKEVVFLSSSELKRLESHKFSQLRMDGVRDCFIFSCYTGLAFNEAAQLSPEHLQLDENGLLWIDMIRQKTQRPISVPLLPRAMKVLKKYGYPNKDGLLLPILSNQKMNSYIKEVAEIVGINKHLTHHVARKTFASTVLLNNDIPIEIVSFLLGHSKTTTTEQHYAKVVKETVLRHISKLNKKLG